MNGEFLSSFASNLHYIVISNYLSGSGSTKVLNTDPIWIRIHNTAYSTSSILYVLYIFGGILYEWLSPWLCDQGMLSDHWATTE